MKLSLLREKLNIKYNFNREPLSELEIDNLDHIKVIGITGSKGKSTVAYLLHKYMKKLGISHQLFCSIKEGSNSKSVNKSISVNIPLRNEEKIFYILEELKINPVEYLILEVSERTIYNKITDDIDFELKVLTNIIPKHNELEFDEETYVNLKLSFLKNSKNNILGLLYGVNKEMMETISEQTNSKPIIYSTRYLASIKGVEESDVEYILYNVTQKLEGFRFGVLQNGNVYQYQTNLLFKYSALNLTCLIAILNTLGIYKQTELYEMLKDIKVMAREETFKYNNRLVIVGTSLVPTLEELKEMKNQNIIKGKIIVVAGSPGLGFVTWKTNDYDQEERKKSRQFAMEYVKKYADKVYITENNSAATQFSKIANELANYLGSDISYIVEPSRYLAIQKAILESDENDVIYISGRGNRGLLYTSENKVTYFNDLEVVKKIIEGGK